jgi:hypothetical protein
MFKKAMENEENQSVALHKPGAEFESQGQRFKVTSNGKLEALAKSRSKKRRKSQRAARRKNRMH